MITLHTSPILQLRAAPEGRVEGYGSTFGHVDSYGDTVAPGAFTATLKAHKAAGTAPLMLWSHQRDRPIGRWQEVKEDARGLFMVGQLNLKTQAGKEAFAHLEAGDLSGMSIGYTVDPAGQELRNGVNVLKAVDLHEVSIVTLPADEHARVTAVKHLEGRPETRREFERALTAMGFTRREAERIASKGFADFQPEEDEDGLALLRVLQRFA